MIVMILFLIQICECMEVCDILKAEYLPSTLMIEEAAVDLAGARSISDETKFTNSTEDGNIRSAYTTMHYHRSMMNEYLCRSYVVEEILSELGTRGVSRLGVIAKNHRNSKPQDSLLKDQGSSMYRDWLSRSTLLDDVYRHYDQMGSHDGGGMSGDFETGEVTGYAVQTQGGKWPSSMYGPPPSYPSYGGKGGDVSHSSIPPPGPDYAIEDIEHHGGGDEEYYYHPEHHSSHKGLALEDLFELALTALAFLAFGMFIMYLILNCMMGAQGTTIVMSTMTTTTTAEASRFSNATGRAINDDYLNEMAHRILTSVDALLELNTMKNPKSRSCLQRILCQNNKYSRSLNGNLRIWLPVWSFGISWFTGRIGENRLKNLEASVLGLGNADCHQIYKTCQKHEAY